MPGYGYPNPVSAGILPPAPGARPENAQSIPGGAFADLTMIRSDMA